MNDLAKLYKNFIPPKFTELSNECVINSNIKCLSNAGPWGFLKDIKNLTIPNLLGQFYGFFPTILYFH